MEPLSPKSGDGQQKQRTSLKQEGTGRGRPSRAKPNFDLPPSAAPASGPAGKQFKGGAKKARHSKRSDENRALTTRKSEEWMQLQYADRRAMYQVAVAEKRAHRKSLCDVDGNLNAKSKFLVAIQSIRESCHDVMKEKEALHILQELKGEADSRTDVQNRWRRYGHLAVTARNIKRNRFVDIQRQLKAMLKNVFEEEQPEEVQSIVSVMADVNSALAAVNDQLAFLRKKAYNAEALMDGISLSVRDAIATSERLLSQAWVREVGGLDSKGNKQGGEQAAIGISEAELNQLPEDLQQDLRDRITKAEMCFDKLRSHLRILVALQPKTGDRTNDSTVREGSSSPKVTSPGSPTSPSASNNNEDNSNSNSSNSKSAPSSPPTTASKGLRSTLGPTATPALEEAPSLPSSINPSPFVSTSGDKDGLTSEQPHDESAQNDLVNIFEELLCSTAIDSMMTTAFTGQLGPSKCDEEEAKPSPDGSGPPKHGPRTSRTSAESMSGDPNSPSNGSGRRRKHKRGSSNRGESESEGDKDKDKDEGSEAEGASGSESSSSSTSSSSSEFSSSSASDSESVSAASPRSGLENSGTFRRRRRKKGARGGEDEALQWAWTPKKTVRQMEARTRWSRLEAAVDRDFHYRSNHGGKAQNFAAAGIEAVLLLRREQKKAAGTRKNVEEKRRRVAEALAEQAQKQQQVQWSTLAGSKSNSNGKKSLLLADAGAPNALHLPRLIRLDPSTSPLSKNALKSGSGNGNSSSGSINNCSNNSNSLSVLNGSDEGLCKREWRRKMELEQHLDKLKRLEQDLEPTSARTPVQTQRFAMATPRAVPSPSPLSARATRPPGDSVPRLPFGSCSSPRLELQESVDSSENSRTLWNDWLTVQSRSLRQPSAAEQSSPPAGLSFKARSARQRHVPARHELYTELPGPAPINLIHV